MNLIEVVGRILDVLEHDESFAHFVLDGQSAVLEDHLQAAPFDSPRIGRLVRAGRLSLGPWYILPDEFLVSGEATVRNLILGRKVARRFGPVQQVGYLPDTFGHLAQIPQILRLAGIDSFVFTRGMDDRTDEVGWLFRWAAPDGTEVLAVNQCDGYCNAGGLGFSEIWHAHTRREVQPGLAVQKVRDLLAKMAARPGHEPALLNNGCDHFPPQQDFGRILAALREAFPDTELRHAGLEDFLAAVRDHAPDEDRPRLEGELLGGRDHPILSGVWSTRMVLKQENEICQNLLQRYVEPLAAMAWLRWDDPWPGALLDETWKELLRNHPHDSICGCSVDEVHRDMRTRFAGVRQTAHQCLAKLTDRLAPAFARRAEDDRDTVLTVVNPLPVVRDEVVERLVVLQPLGYDLENLRLLDEDGLEVPLRIVERRFLERFWGIDYRQENFYPEQRALLDVYLTRFTDRIVGTEADRDTKDCFLAVQFLARDLPALGHRQYRLTDEPATAQAPQPVAVTANLDTGTATAVLENEHLRVALHPDGSFDLTEKATGRFFPGLNRLESTEDIGDEYDYSPAPESMTVRPVPREGTVGVEEDTGLGAHALAVFVMDLPRSICGDRRRRCDETKLCTAQVHLRLCAGDRHVEIETEFDNRAEDHRLRAEFPTGLACDEVISDGHFLVHRRPIERPGGEGWTQPAPATWPQQDFSLLQDERGGLAVLNRGLPEFETRRDANGHVTFCLTLLRAVGWLSRDDFPTRNDTNAGPTLFTPEAQCPGPNTYRYAVAPFAGDFLDADIKGLSERYRTPPLTHQGTADQMRPGLGSLLRKTDPRAVVTAIARAEAPVGAAEEEGDRLIVRLYNQTDEPICETLELGVSALQAMKVDFFEQALPADLPERTDAAVTRGGGRVRVPLAPFEIATVEITLQDKNDWSAEA